MPLILSREEVQKLLEAPRNLRHRTLLAILYGCGLRVAEATQLKVSDIDSARHMLRFAAARGVGPRQTLLGKPPAAGVAALLLATPTSLPTGFVSVRMPTRPIPRSRPPILPVGKRRKMRASLNPFIRIHCGMPSQPTCWKRASTCPPSRSCSVTPTWRPRRVTCRSPMSKYVRSTVSPLDENWNRSTSFPSRDDRSSA